MSSIPPGNRNETASADILERIRSDAFEFRRTRAGASRAQPMTTEDPSPTLQPLPVLDLQPAFVPSLQGYHVRDLLRFHHAVFIDVAYRALLNRPPDPEGLRNYMEALASGRSKIMVLGGLRYSKEGRALKVDIRGLAWRYAIEKACRIPALGYLIQVVLATARLPASIRHHRALEFYAAGQSAAVKAHVDAAVTALRRDITAVAHSAASALADQARMQSEINERSIRIAQMLESNLGELASRVRRVQDAVQDLDANLSTRIDAAVGETKALQEELRRLESKADEAEIALRSALDQFAQRAAEDRNAIAALFDDVNLNRSAFEAQMMDLRTELTNGLARTSEVLEEKVGQLSTGGSRLEEAGRVEAARRIAEARSMDSFYAAFEDHFRGPREEIKSRMEVYLPILEQAGVGGSDRLVVDLGCGRGEWLEILRGRGLHGRGVDINQVSLAFCRELGLEVVEADALEYMRSLPEGRLGAVTGMHIVEHLPFKTLLDLVDQCIRVLQPGGLLIFETPNPRNILVSSNTFYLDPTHGNPIPSDLLKFVLESRGFGGAEVKDLHPSPHQWTALESEMDEYLVTNLFGGQDYAVIGSKA